MRRVVSSNANNFHYGRAINSMITFLSPGFFPIEPTSPTNFATQRLASIPEFTIKFRAAFARFSDSFQFFSLLPFRSEYPVISTPVLPFRASFSTTSFNCCCAVVLFAVCLVANYYLFAVCCLLFVGIVEIKVAVDFVLVLCGLSRLSYHNCL